MRLASNLLCPACSRRADYSWAFTAMPRTTAAATAPLFSLWTFTVLRFLFYNMARCANAAPATAAPPLPFACLRAAMRQWMLCLSAGRWFRPPDSCRRTMFSWRWCRFVPPDSLCYAAMVRSEPYLFTLPLTLAPAAAPRFVAGVGMTFWDGSLPARSRCRRALPACALPARAARLPAPAGSLPPDSTPPAGAGSRCCLG